MIEVLSPIAEREANLEIVALPEAGVSARLVHTVFAMPKLAAQWGAEVFFSVDEVALLRMPCATIASFRNANVFTREVPAPDLRDRLRFLVLHFTWDASAEALLALFAQVVAERERG